MAKPRTPVNQKQDKKIGQNEMTIEVLEKRVESLRPSGKVWNKEELLVVRSCTNCSNLHKKDDGCKGEPNARLVTLCESWDREDNVYPY